ncbi:hypothetical protein RLEG12_07785 (plasmid) [Rhizobium leguminosarum bv. trifolii CB782]|nr:hypothetical protein RLEG12_07785 [Rhizobium leguminosarum bv. trifolii CB782]
MASVCKPLAVTAAQFMRLQVEPHLVVELVGGDCADQDVVLSSISARALSDSRSLPIAHQTAWLSSSTFMS